MGSLLLQKLRSGDGMAAPPRALVVILFAAGEGAEQAQAFALQWQASVPQTAFVGVELNAPVGSTAIAALQDAVAVAATARSIQMSQIILLGAGEVGRFAVDLVLRGAILGTGVIGLDISPYSLPTHIVPAAAKVRLVQHSTSEDAEATSFRHIVEAMQRQDIDVRSMILPDAAHDAPEVRLRACGTFLVELVANASRFSLPAWRWHHARQA